MDSKMDSRPQEPTLDHQKMRLSIALPLKRRRSSVTKATEQAAQYPESKIAVLKAAVRQVLASLGEDVDREGLLDTPKRVAKAWMDLTIGYRQDTVNMLGITSDRPGGAFFSDDSIAGGQNGVVLVRDIDFASTDESTLLPFHGRCHIAYIPSNGVVLGLSKMARVTKHFGKRLQSHSRLVTEIAGCLQTHLGCQGIAVVMEARQLSPVSVESSKMEICIGGSFSTDSNQFEELMALLHAPAPPASFIHTLSPPPLASSPTGSTECLPATAPGGTAGSDESSQSAGDASAVDGAALALASTTSSDADNGQSVIAFAFEDEEEGTEARLATSIPAPAEHGFKKALYLPPTPSAVRHMEKSIETMIREVGEDLERPGLGKSAMRYAAGLLSSTSGYHMPLPSREAALVPLAAAGAEVAIRSVMRSDGVEVKLVTGCFQFNSQCEHHMLPFHGRALIAYTLPATPGASPGVISKEAMEQVVRVFTRRLQVQERITHQLADATEDMLAVQNEGRAEGGVMVVCEAVHMCMLARGVENHSGATATVAVRGAFESSAELRRAVLAAFGPQ